VAIIDKDSYEEWQYNSLEINDNLTNNAIPVRYVVVNEDTEVTKTTKYNSVTKEFNIPIPEEYQGLCILRKTL